MRAVKGKQDLALVWYTSERFASQRDSVSKKSLELLLVTFLFLGVGGASH